LTFGLRFGQFFDKRTRSPWTLTPFQSFFVIYIQYLVSRNDRGAQTKECRQNVKLI
jgi:hypothetical protein